ncbi:hypothetical protein [Christensenella tenuis]|jgi:hypothetical protein|nr:hypothetical protein [Christensenella tenuis]
MVERANKKTGQIELTDDMLKQIGGGAGGSAACGSSFALNLRKI